MSWFRQTPNQWGYQEPIYINHKSEPLRLFSNDDTIFAISTTDYNYHNARLISSHGNPQLAEYSHQHDEWIKYKVTLHSSFSADRSEFLLSPNSPVAMFQNTIYLFKTAYTTSIILFQLDRINHQCIIKSFKNELLTRKMDQHFESCVLIPEQKKIHIVGGMYPARQQHLIYDMNENKIIKEHNLTKKFNLTKKVKFDRCGLVRIKNNKILMIGGSKTFKEMHSYDIKNNEWNDNGLPLTFHNKNYHLNDSCVSILNKSMILIFNGYDKNIYIYDDIDTNKQCYISDIKCPIEDEENYKIFVINNDNKTLNLLIWGYIRHFWNNFSTTENRFLPDYLIKIIYRYGIDEWVHLFANCMFHKEHYKMNVMDIINNKTTV